MEKKLFHRFFLFAILLLQTILFAQNSKQNPQIFTEKKVKEGNTLYGNGKYTNQDHAVFANKDFDDSSWGNVDLSSDNVFKDNKIYWIRYYFKVDSSLVNKPLNLYISQQGASEIYLNGEKVKTLGKIGNSQTKKFILKDDEPLILAFPNLETNVIAIRFQPYIKNSNESGLINFTSNVLSLTFTSANEFVKEKIAQTEKFNFYAMLFCGIFLALGFIHLLLFLFYRKALYNLFFSLYNFSICVMSYIVLMVYKIKYLADKDLYTIIFFVALLTFGFSLSGFVNNLFGKSKIRFWIMMSIPVILIILFPFSTELSAVFAIFYLVFAAIESFYLIIKAMIRREKSAFIVGGGILIFFIFIVFRLILVLLNIDFSLSKDSASYFSMFVLISFPVSISAYLAWQFASTNLSLKKQLNEVNRLSEINLQQEQEKQHILQNQNEVLEKQVNERTQELQIEKQKTENLLLNILPEEVAEELKENGSSEAKHYDEVSVLFTDFVSFTQNSEKMGAEKMLKELNDCFTAFDLIMEKRGLEKIKTIGDAYMAVCGLPHENPNHAYQTVLAALDIIQFIENRKISNPETLDIRIGVNSGALIAGIVGVKKFAYDIWGDTVNTAARMEQNSEKGKINISDSTYQLVKEKINCEYRGKIDTKGKGEIDMYFAFNIKKDDL